MHAPAFVRLIDVWNEKVRIEKWKKHTTSKTQIRFEIIIPIFELYMTQKENMK